MAQFFKFLFASCLGVILAVIILFGIGSLIIAGLVQQAERPVEIKPNSVLHIELNQPIPEKTNNLQVNPFEFPSRKVLGLREIIQTIENAKEDDHIKGIFLNVDAVMTTGIVSTSDLRKAMIDFRESGKFIIAYSKYYTQSAYYLASAADRIYLNPLGILDFRGFAIMTPFFKEMLDKVGIEMQVFYAGQFKSATEPYRLNEMSEQNKLQTREFLESIYRNFLEDISASRGIPVEDLKRIANNYEAGMASGALSSGLVDVIGHEDEVKQELRERLGLDDDEKIPSVSLEDFNRSNPPLKDYSVRDKIAIIFAEGSIVAGEGENGIIGDDKYMKIIEDLRNDASVKAIVLRVNSPGGNALASENIWKELQLTRDEGKPVIVSMSDYAASGGYYIASASDSIFAEPKTLTGSIGVLSVIPNTRELLDEKIGINFDSIKTADMATGINILFDMTPKEERYMFSLTDSLYETFLDRVAQNRGMTRDAIHEIAQGRIWTGSKAQEIGLVDRIGGLEEAIQSAASLASLEEYRITEYPRVKDPFQQLLEEWLNMETGNATQNLLRHEAPELYEHYKFLKDIRSAKGVQARLPFVVEFD